MIRLLFIFIFLCLSGLIHAQTSFLNRPSKTESAVVFGKGVFQLEATYELEQSCESDEREKETLFPGLLFCYGLGWGVELRIATQYERFKSSPVQISGFTDLDLGAKIKLLKAKNQKSEVSLISHLFMPTGSNGISNERYGNETLLLAWHELSDKVGIEYNIGYSNFEIDTDVGNFIYSFVIDYEINEVIGVFGETYGELIEFEELEASLDLGIAFQFADNFERELAAGTGINHRLFFTLVGLS